MILSASYSTICADELLSKLIPQYLVEKPLTCYFLQRGSNDTYQVNCSDAVYSLRIYRHGWHSRDAIDFEIAALNYLKERGASVAYPIEKREGGFVTGIQAPEGLRYMIMTSHAKGNEPGYCGRKHIYEKDAELFGASVAELHNLSKGFETEHRRPRLEISHLLDTSFNVVKSFLQKYSTNLNVAGNNPLNALESVVIDLRSNLSELSTSNLDIGFCHGDCHGSNVHNVNGLITHFDFEFCGFGFRVFELATFKWGIWGDDIKADLWSSFLKSYRSQRDISAEDFALIDTFVVIRQLWWMAFIMASVKDFGHGDANAIFVTQQIANLQEMMKSAHMDN